MTARFSPSTIYTQIHTTCLEFLASFTTARTKGSSALNAALSPTCKRYYSPVSLEAMLPPSIKDGESNESYASRMQVELDTTVSSKEPFIRYVIIDESARKAAVNAIMYTKSVKTQNEYPFEFVWIMEFNDEGTLIERIQVNADAGMAQNFFEENVEVAAAMMESGISKGS